MWTWTQNHTMVSYTEVANVAKKANSLQKINFFGGRPCSMIVVVVTSSKVIKAKA